jgi:hypothetical protein
MIALPERGRIGIFNRSHYEECLVVRVHPEILAKQKMPPKLVTKDIWRDRFEDISAMERYIARNGTVILKFFLNVSREEQRERFLERLEDPAKNWKFSLADIGERKLWDKYQAAYQDLIRHTSTKHAPWHIVPADHKWFARVVIGSAMTPLLTGQVDVVTGWTTNVTALKPLGPDRIAMRLWDQGIRLYAMPYYATNETLTNEPHLLEAFLRAAGRGWELAFRETERAVQILVEEYPILRYQDELDAARELLTYVFTEKTRDHGWATMDPETWKEQIVSHEELGQFTKRVPTVEDVMTPREKLITAPEGTGLEEAKRILYKLKLIKLVCIIWKLPILPTVALLAKYQQINDNLVWLELVRLKCVVSVNNLLPLNLT